MINICFRKKWHPILLKAHIYGDDHFLPLLRAYSTFSQYRPVLCTEINIVVNAGNLP